MIKQYIRIFTSICMLIITSPFLYSQFEFMSKVQEIRVKGYIVVGMTANDNYPFYYTIDKSKVTDNTSIETNPENLTGMDIDIVKEIASRLGVTLKINRDAESFDALIPFVVDKKIDLVVSKLSRTLERSKKVLYSIPYIVFRQALFLNRVQLARANIDNNKLVSLLKNFTGTLGVVKKSSYVRYANSNFPLAKLEMFNTWDEVVEAVLKGTVFGIYRDELEIFKVLQKNPTSNLMLKPVLLKDKTDAIAIAVHPKEYHFLFFVNRVLDNMYIETNLQAIFKKYRRNN